jgi:DNA-3-methyladenine glycosylase I
MDDKIRCEWGREPEIYRNYHDYEWGVPIHDDRLLFEMLNLEGAQAGLTWYLILQKRENYRLLFDNFEADKVARYSDEKIQSLLLDARIVRNRLKIQAVVTNSIAFLDVQDEFGSFDRYLWQFIGGKPITNHWTKMSELPASTPLSDALSKDLKKRGFKFIGTTICYAFMQAVGMVNDHTLDCYRYGEIIRLQ